MRAVVQRVLDCRVEVEDRISGEIDDGLLVYLGIASDDNDDDVSYLADKVSHLRIFADQNGKMNLSALDLDKEILVVSQFTLYADTRKGRRPSYTRAADPHSALQLYGAFVAKLEEAGFSPKKGVFGALMSVTYTNHGPVTIVLDSKKSF